MDTGPYTLTSSSVSVNWFGTVAHSLTTAFIFTFSTGKSSFLDFGLAALAGGSGSADGAGLPAPAGALPVESFAADEAARSWTDAGAWRGACTGADGLPV